MAKITDRVVSSRECVYEYQSLGFVGNQIPQSVILLWPEFIKTDVHAVEHKVAVDLMNTESNSKRN